MIRILMSLVVMAIAIPATAQPLDLDAIARHPGTQVTKRSVNGVDIVEIKRGGVTVTIEGDSELSIDGSGKAVYCFWNLAVVAKMSADLCYPGEFAELSRMLAEQIDAANTFIAANSLRPITKTQLEKVIEDRMVKAAIGIKAAGVPPAQNRVCRQQREDDLVPLNAQLEKYRREFQDVLAVPRPPAQNPCY